MFLVTQKFMDVNNFDDCVKVSRKLRIARYLWGDRFTNYGSNIAIHISAVGNISRRNWRCELLLSVISLKQATCQAMILVYIYSVLFLLLLVWRPVSAQGN